MKILKAGLSLILVGMITFSSTAIAVSAAENSEYTYSLLEDSTIRIDKYNGADTKVEIPSSIDGKTVSQIGDRAFEYNRTVSEVEIPNTVSIIGEKAFNDCVNLKKVEFSDSITSIEKDAFFSCTRLENVDLPDNLVKLGDGAFYDCQSIVTITVPGTVSDFGEFVFGSNDSLTSATLEEGITTVPPLTFYCDEKLTSVKLPDTLTLIDRKAFYKNTALSDFSLPNSVDEIGEKAFYHCYAIKQFSFNGSKIGDNALAYCMALETINFSDNLKSIGAEFIAGSAQVESLILPKSLTDISSKAFCDSNLKSVTIDSDNPSYMSFNNTVYTLDMTKIIAYLGQDDSFYIPDSVTEIADYSFSNSNVEEVTFTDSLERIGDNAFSMSNISTAILPESLKYLGESAFEGCYSLTKVSVPSGIKEIKPMTFMSCSQLSNVTLADGVEEIGDNAFSADIALQKITLPQSVSRLCANAFGGIDVLKVIDIENNSNFVLENNVLYNKDKSEIFICSDRELKEFTIPESVEKVNDYAFSLCYYIDTINIPDSVTQIGNKAIGCSIRETSAATFKPKTKIIGNKNSAAYEYAKANDIAFFTEKPYLNNETVTLNGGETQQLVLNGADIEEVVFNSSDENVATVDNNGVITAVGKGETKVFASVSNVYFICTVTVKSDGTKSVNPLESYTEVTRDNLDEWTKEYSKANNNFEFSKIDYPAIYCYTTEQYVPIVATQKGGSYLDRTKQTYGDDYKQYYTYSDNLSFELKKFNLHDNTILFSGTGNVSVFTGSDSTMKAMRNAISKQYTSPSVISTSISYEISSRFAPSESGYGTVMEIYAPKGFTQGAYIQSFSKYPMEYELLLDKDVTFEVLDAGYKEVSYRPFPLNSFGEENPATETTISRFLKLKIIDTSVEEETTSTQPSSTTVPETSQNTTSQTDSQDATSSTQNSSTSPTSAKTANNSTTSDTTPIKTGNAGVAVVVIIILSAIAVMIIIERRLSNNTKQK